ncbi:MAG: hypothetical protein NT136_04255 [Candidatus Moranbacteria bacterium]|nr:hypothetical protein [Candidatus Moranbacteria bacterium]
MGVKIFEIIKQKERERVNEYKRELWLKIFIPWLQELKKERCKKTPNIVFDE